jgi:hypothetical protein
MKCAKCLKEFDRGETIMAESFQGLPALFHPICAEAISTNSKSKMKRLKIQKKKDSK